MFVLPRMAVFVGLLARCAALCGQVGLQALDINISLAINANPVFTRGDSYQGFINFTDFFNVHVDDREVEVHQQVCH